MSLRRANRSSEGLLPSVVCVSVIEELHRVRLGPLELSNQDKSGGRGVVFVGKLSTKDSMEVLALWFADFAFLTSKFSCHVCK